MTNLRVIAVLLLIIFTCSCQNAKEAPDPIIRIIGFKQVAKGKQLACEAILENASKGDLKGLKVFLKVYADHDEIIEVPMTGTSIINKGKTEKYKVLLNQDEIRRLSDNREINFAVRLKGFYYGEGFRGYPFALVKSYFSNS